MRPASILALAVAQALSPAVSAQSDSSSVNRTVYDDVAVLDGPRNISIPVPLQAVRGVDPGTTIKPDTELRILCIGDSITVGSGSSDWNGYREKLSENLSGDDVLFVGTETRGDMEDNHFAAWSGKTIQFMADHSNASLAQRPNVVLVHGGTNDMKPTDAADPDKSAGLLGTLIDQILELCPDAVVMVAVIINSCVPRQKDNVAALQDLIPGVVRTRLAAGKHVLAVDFAELGDEVLSRDCVHPNDGGYAMMADQWYNAMTRIPRSWIQAPVGNDPEGKSAGNGEDSEGSNDGSDSQSSNDGEDGSDDESAATGKHAPFWIPSLLIMAWAALADI